MKTSIDGLGMFEDMHDGTHFPVGACSCSRSLLKDISKIARKDSGIIAGLYKEVEKGIFRKFYSVCPN